MNTYILCKLLSYAGDCTILSLNLYLCNPLVHYCKGFSCKFTIVSLGVFYVSFMLMLKDSRKGVRKAGPMILRDTLHQTVVPLFDS